jgi:phage terminase small subunit
VKNEHGLTPQQEAFAAGLAAGMTQAEAYRKAYPAAVRWKDDSVWPKASALAANGKVQARVQTLMAIAASDSEVTIDWVVKQYRALVLADARELTELRRGCCRFCWGIGFKRQRTAAEREAAYAKWFAMSAKQRAKTGELEFNEQGGIGFHKHRPPNPECPECFGDGVEEPFFKDVRQLSPEARRLYAGVKVSEKGIELKTHDPIAALNQLARYAGAFERDNRQKSDPLVALLRELGGNVVLPAAGAGLPDGGDDDGDEG